MTTPRLAQGVMTIALNGQDLDLLATPGAAKTICRAFGGLTEAYARVDRYDFEAVVTVINAATNRTGAAAEATETAVFEAGIVTVAALVIQYLSFLSAGGKPPQAAPAADGAAAGKAD